MRNASGRYGSALSILGGSRRLDFISSAEMIEPIKYFGGRLPKRPGASGDTPCFMSTLELREYGECLALLAGFVFSQTSDLRRLAWYASGHVGVFLSLLDHTIRAVGPVPNPRYSASIPEGAVDEAWRLSAFRTPLVTNLRLALSAPGEVSALARFVLQKTATEIGKRGASHNIRARFEPEAGL